MSFMPKTYFDRSYATVEYRSDEQIVFCELTEYAEGEDYREYMNSVIEAAKANRASDVVADVSDAPTLAQADQDWTEKTWGPNAEEAGVKSVAMLVPESVVSKMSMEGATEDPEDDIERQWFDNYEDAVSWTRSIA
jgi:hypothetical protein